MKLELYANSTDLPAEERMYNQPEKMEASWRAMLHDSDKCTQVKVLSINFEKLAHKALLSSRVPFFKDAMLHDFEGQDTIEVPPEISPTILKLIIDYAYYVQPDITLDTVQPLLEAAAFFRIEDLWKFCDRFIAKRVVLSQDNCIGVQSYAVAHGAKLLAKTAGQYMAEHFTAIADSDRFKRLSQKELESLLSVDEIGLPDEEKFWEALVAWMRADEGSRKELMPHLMKLVRMPCLTVRYIHKNVQTHPYIDESLICRQMLHTVLCFKTDPTKEECRQACAAEFKLSNRSASRQQVSYIYAFTSNSTIIGSNNIQVLKIPGGKWEELIWVDVPDSRLKKVTVVKNCIYCVKSDDSLNIYNPTTEACFVVEGDQDRPTIDDSSWLISEGGKLFVCCLSSSETKLMVWSYDTTAKTWQDGHVSVRKHHKTHLVAVCGVVQRNSCGTVILCCFGYISNSHGSKYVFLRLINPQTNHSTEGRPMPTGRITGYAVVGYNGNVIVAGGGDEANTSTNTVEMYDMASNEWCSMPDMIVPRRDLKLIVASDCLYAIGGTDNEVSVEYLDLTAVNFRWRPCTSQLLGHPQAKIRSAVVWQCLT